MIRAVIDVNVIVSAIIGPLGASRQVLLHWEVGRFTSVTSTGILAEVDTKLALPRIARRYHLRPEDAAWVYRVLRTQSDFIEIPVEEERVVTGDPEDDYVLATVRLGQADYLVTGDHGLLALGHYARAMVLTPKDFLHQLPQKDGPAAE